MTSVAIIGAGPAGLSAAYEILSCQGDCEVVVYEKDSTLGGLSKTLVFEGGRIDIGGHRFFSKDSEVLDLWRMVLPEGDEGMLVRDRFSHILWNSKLIFYPLRLDAQTMSALGATDGLKVVLSYLKSKLGRREIRNLEDFYIDRFGAELYSTFFKDYTFKLWGIPASAIAPDWGEQRVRKISLGYLARSFLGKGSKGDCGDRSLIDRYNYPAFGSGQLWDELGREIVEMGGRIETGCVVEKLFLDGSRVTGIECRSGNEVRRETFDYVISTMPLGELGEAVQGSPYAVKDICNSLRYRDIVVVGIEVLRSSMGNMFDMAGRDSWIYIQDRSLPFGRCQIMNNWSPFAANRPDCVLLELEYYCNAGDELWEESDRSLADRTVEGLIRSGICGEGAVPESFFVYRAEKAYPVYADGYHRLGEVREWVDSLENLMCAGRNGQHKYNNMDHAVATGIRAARSILNDGCEKRSVWDVNTGKGHLEE